MPTRVLIAGGGVAGLEALIALRAHAGDRVAVTLLTPEDVFSVRALSVEDPFARPVPPVYSIAKICDEHGAAFERGALQSVDVAGASVLTTSGTRLPYDALLVAVGATTDRVFSEGISFDGMSSAEAVHGLVEDLEQGSVHKLAFVVPTGMTWPLPLYELAFLAAHRARGMSTAASHPELTLVTPEPMPLAPFGAPASAVVEDLLLQAGITVRTDTSVADVRGGEVLGADGAVIVSAQRIVTIPRLSGRPVEGLPSDEHGFLPVDEGCAVRGAAGVWGAGDGTDFPLKQGGIAAQQAEVAARGIAAAAGAPVRATHLHPRLRAKLLTGAGATYLSEALPGGTGSEEASQASEMPLWSSDTKVHAPRLGAHLGWFDPR